MSGHDAPRCACGHLPYEHEQGTGCLHGWRFDDQGVALLPDGCHCLWAHVTSPERKGA